MLMRTLVFFSMLSFALAAPGAAAPPGEAEGAADGGPGVEEWLDRLDAADYERREGATRKLMGLDALSEERLARALRRADSPERRNRLTRIAMHRYYRRMNPGDLPRDRGVASIGIDLSAENTVRPGRHTGLDHTAIFVSGTKPGFPGYVHLRPGDLILAINGKPLTEHTGWEEISQRIKRYRAGQPITLGILRDGERRSVRFRLDSYLRLNQIYNGLLTAGVDPERYPPWRNHLREMLGGERGIPEVRFEPEAEAEPAGNGNEAGAGGLDEPRP